ncbi:oxidoreductase [Hazenella sp. IB182357]|uniref:Oxidoreductase n=1 Tax=Polycladospora coralii TaxID=2771432 RepID=A0A926RTC1_9BACL|nr:oxidoreductase [Polycladospora coralii]MBD1371503.1 oxidoreductase [Polycladospora coralii]MBS7528969.1 oxidoreductase [Polycladospora coralii]
MPHKTALVLGSTGLIGTALIKQLLDCNQFTTIHALARKELNMQHEKLKVHQINMRELNSIPEHFQVDTLFCCIGTTMKKAGSKEAFREVDYDIPLQAAQMAKKEGVGQYLIVSAMGADPNSFFFYNRVKGELEDQLQLLSLPSLHIFRPSLLLGERDEVRVGEQIGATVSKFLNPILGGSLKKYQAIDGSDVARAMIQVSLQDQPGDHIYLSDEIKTLATS